jgi:hypothetical protein
MAQGMLPNFRRFYESATVFTTDAGEEPPNLEPWIQWPTVHSGMSFAEHGIFHLGDGRELRQKCMAEVLSDAGIPVGVCGSMNLNYGHLNGYLLPDPWDKAGSAHPDGLQTFYQTVAQQVQESSREDGSPRPQLARFGWFLLRHGLTLGTAWAIGKQLLQERLDGGLRWRRAGLLDQLQYDVFRCLNRRYGIRFATFFCNSTAHFQHYYWRNWQPEQFSVPPPATDHSSLGEAIPYGYRSMDRLIGRFLRNYPHAVLILCTALSQQPWTNTTKCTFRPKQFENLLAFARVSIPAEVKPVMAEEFHVECPSAEDAVVVERQFEALTIDGEPLMKVKREGSSLFAGCRFTDTAVLDQPITRRPDGARQAFGDLFYMIHTMRSGRHHPDGVLWVRNGTHQVIEEKVPLTDIAPTVLAHFGVEQPDYMHGRPLPLYPEWASTY